MTQNASLKQKSTESKSKWLKLALVGITLLLIPRRSSNKSDHVVKLQNDIDSAKKMVE